MIKKLLAIFCLATLMSGCIKSSDTTTAPQTCTYTTSTAVAPASEVTYLQNYLSTRSISAKKDSSGIFYSIDSTGTGTVTPTVCSVILVTYSGKLMLADNSNPVFDSNSSGLALALGGLIVGWQKGLPLIRKGGSITLYIPPSLGYGATDKKDNYGVVVIPANSYLRFSIQLLDLQ